MNVKMHGSHTPKDTNGEGLEGGKGGVRQAWQGIIFATGDDSLGKLRECLRGELSAVETYELALRAIKGAPIASALMELRDSHARRVALIRNRLISMGAEASETSGAWGTFAKIIQRGADLLGDKAAISALVEGEDHGLKKYSEGHGDCDTSTRELIVTELLPEQQRTHDICSTLDRFVKAT